MSATSYRFMSYGNYGWFFMHSMHPVTSYCVGLQSLNYRVIVLPLLLLRDGTGLRKTSSYVLSSILRKVEKFFPTFHHSEKLIEDA